VWEEGRWSGTRVTRFAAFACAVLVGVDVATTGGLSIIFDCGFAVLCVAMAFVVRPSDFFRVGILPPLLLLGVCGLLSVVHRAGIATHQDGIVQALISGLAHHSGALLVGYALCLTVLAIRGRVLHSKRAASPAPYRVISGTPEVKSTTVVGSEPDSPESRTASSI
jgi:hypothetical protein